MPSKVEKFRITDEQAEALAAFADDQDITKSDVIRQALAAYVPSFPGDAPVQGKRTDLLREMRCGWCGHVQEVATWDDECRKCGECEFVNIETNNQ